jgi:hypothetical protein
MKRSSLAFAAIVFCLLVANSCKKSSPWNFNTAVTTTIAGQTYQYAAPAGLVNYANGTYQVNGYQPNSSSNTIAFSMIDSPYTCIDTFSPQTANSLIITTGGVIYNSAITKSMVILNMTVKGNNITGTFTGSLYSSSGNNVTISNGTLSTSY